MPSPDLASFVLVPGRLSLAALREFVNGPRRVELAPEAWTAIDAGRGLVADLVKGGQRTYGINTGVGSLADRTISPTDLEELQRRLVLSNAVGTGPLLEDTVVRRVLLLKLNALASGHAGVRRELVEALLRLLEHDVLPAIPAKGSVGASGDLAPLAHLGAALLGAGEVRHQDRLQAAQEGLARIGLAPMALAPKEGLALVNGTQVSTALAVEGLLAAEAALAAAIVAGALSVEAALGQEMAFDPRIQVLRGQEGQIAVAAAQRGLLDGSGLRRRARREGRLQDPYCLRCQPQVMGACLDHLQFAAGIVGREVNAFSDNPIMLPATGEVLYGGNFHAQPVGMAADVTALALTVLGGMAERRIAFLTDAHLSKLPAFLVEGSGLDSGFMVAQAAAAALASENKSLAHPATADSIPTVANHEDYVSMATFAALRLGEMAENAATIVAIELLAACQGLEFRRPGRSSETLELVHAAVRERVAPWAEDRFFAPDVAAVTALVRSGWFLELVPGEVRLTA
jgi:histidine ammonia-lyase